MLRVVAVEEMLHLTLAANILNAVGGTPDLTRRGFVPRFPAFLPDGENDFQVDLQRFSRERVETFLNIERPAAAPRRRQSRVVLRRGAAARGCCPLSTRRDDAEMRFYSIGEFYQEIRRGLAPPERRRNPAGALFVGDPARQITPEYYYSGGGEIIPVTDLASAHAGDPADRRAGRGLGRRRSTTMKARCPTTTASSKSPEGAITSKATKPTADRRARPRRLGRRLPDQDGRVPCRLPRRVGTARGGRRLQRLLRRLPGAVTQALSGQPELFVQVVGDMFRIREKAYRLMRNPIPGMNGLNAAPTFEMPLPPDALSHERRNR